MNRHVFLSTWLSIFACYDGLQSTNPSRSTREAAGALYIVNNHAQPIHADVKSDNTRREITEKVFIPKQDKPCSKNQTVPSHVESGVVFQVTAPEDTIYHHKSLRKSLHDPPTTVDLFRTAGRLITLFVLVISAVLEFYPLLKNLYQLVYTFLYL